MFLIRSCRTDFELEWTWAYEAPLQCNFSTDCVPKHSFSHVYHISQLGTRYVSVSGAACIWILIIVPSLELLAYKFWTHDWADLYSNNVPIFIYDNDMTKGTLFEIANPYEDTPTTKHLSGIPDTVGLGFWWVLKVLHMQFRLRCQINNCLCNRQPSMFTPCNYAVPYEQWRVAL